MSIAVGDKVRHKTTHEQGTVLEISPDAQSYAVVDYPSGARPQRIYTLERVVPSATYAPTLRTSR